MKLYSDEQIEALNECIMCIELVGATEKDIRDYERLTVRLVKAMRQRISTGENKITQS